MAKFGHFQGFSQDFLDPGHSINIPSHEPMLRIWFWEALISFFWVSFPMQKNFNFGGLQGCPRVYFDKKHIEISFLYHDTSYFIIFFEKKNTFRIFVIPQDLRKLFVGQIPTVKQRPKLPLPEDHGKQRPNFLAIVYLGLEKRSPPYPSLKTDPAETTGITLNLVIGNRNNWTRTQA